MLRDTKLFICVSCDRKRTYAAGAITDGARLLRAVKETQSSVNDLTIIRAVECLNGCPHPCAAALRAPGKPTWRFSKLSERDGASLIETSIVYRENSLSISAERRVPKGLSGRLQIIEPRIVGA